MLGERGNASYDTVVSPPVHLPGGDMAMRKLRAQLAMTIGMALGLGLVVGGEGSSAAGAVIAGPETFRSESAVEDERGFQPPAFVRHTDSGWKGDGSTGAATGPVGLLLSGDTVADGAASDSALKSLSRARGELNVFPVMPPFPHVRATNRSEVTRFFTFNSSTLTSVPLDFVVAIDGTITTAAVYEFLTSTTSFAGVTFGLEIVDTSGATVAPIFEVTARSIHSPLTSLSRWELVATSSGAATPDLWLDSIEDITPDTFFTGNQYDVIYIESMKNAYQAPLNTPVGIRLYLETEAVMHGFEVFDAFLEADFFNTATLQQQINPSAAGQATMTELLTVSSASSGAVPEPASLLLFGFGLVGLIGWQATGSRGSKR